MVTREFEPSPRVADYRRVLRKHRWLMTGIFLLTVLTVAIGTFLQTPIYQAVATILIEPEPPKVLNIQDVTPVGAMSPYDPAFYPTQYEIIKSRAVVTRAVEALNLKTAGAGTGALVDPSRVLSGSLAVEPMRNTRLVLIKVAGPDAARAAAEANAIANAYAKYNVELKLKGARDALTWLTEEAGRLRAKVEDSSQALQNYRVKSGILGMQEQRQISAQKIIEANKGYLEAQAQRMSLEAKLGELTQVAKDPAAAGTIFSEADNPLVGKIKGEIGALETEKSKLLKVYKEKHPEIVKVDAQIQHLRDRLDAEFRSTLRSVQTQGKVARAREESQLNAVNQLRREGQELNEKESQYQNLQHEVEANQQLYDSVVKRLKETGVAGGLENSNVRIIEDATPPGAPIRPRKAWNLALSIVAGLVLAFGVAFGLEYLDRTVKTPDDVERYLGLSVIGIVPAFDARRR
jgi:succinoglycan biosynthesis transport protein ExoP